MFCGTSIAPLFSRLRHCPRKMPLLCAERHCIHSGGFSRPPAFAIDRGRSCFRSQNTPHSFQRLLTHARKRCRSRRLRCIFHTAVRCFSKYSAARKTFRFFPAVVIDRGRSRFCARNALHSLRQLLTLANDAAPVVRATYFYTAVRCLSKYSAARQ